MRNFAANGVNRGETVSIGERCHPRSAPCLIPFCHIYVDYNGCIMPCCNVRSDLPAHRPHIVGDLRVAGTSLRGVFTGEPIVAWRKSLVGFGAIGSPCTHCHFAEVPATDENVKLASLWHAASSTR